MNVEEMINLLQEYSPINFDVLDEIKREHRGLYIGSGAYKFGIYMPYWNEVLKIDQPREIGICRKEWEAYQDAKKYGIESILLKPTFCGVIEETKQEIFRQPKIDVASCDLGRVKQKYYENQVKNILESKQFEKIFKEIHFSRVNKLWLAKFILHYGKDFTKSFCKWVKDTKQNDLHAGNIGYLKNRPVILDFAN